VCRSFHSMSLTELPPSTSRVSDDDTTARDRSVVHATHPDDPSRTVCGLLSDEPPCCSPTLLESLDGAVCGQCNRRFCPACIEIAVAWLKIGRTPAGGPFRTP